MGLRSVASADTVPASRRHGAVKLSEGETSGRTGGRRRCHVGAVVAMLAAAPLTAVTGCAALDACHAAWSTTGPTVHVDAVTDTLHVSCSPPPRSHTVVARMDYRRVGDYAPLGRATFIDRIPDQRGYDVPVRVPCVSGWYRATATVTATDAQGDTSEVTLTGVESLITDCGR
jgi:hypothetical protein